MNRSRSFLSVITLLLLSVMFFSCSKGCSRNGPTNETIVTAAYVPAGYYLPFLVMESEGLLEKRGYSLQLQRFQDNAEMVSLLLNDQLDVTAQSSLTMFPIEADNPGLVKFVYGQYLRSYYFVTKKNSGISLITDLKGKKIGTWKSPTAEVFVKLVLRNNGLNDGDYEIKKYNANEWPSMLENGQVDAVFGFDSGVAQLLDKKDYVIFAENELQKLQTGSPIFNGGGFIRSKLIAENPQKARAIRDAMNEAMNIIRDDPKRITKIVMEKIGAPENVLDLVHFDDFHYPNESLYESAEATYRMLKDNDIMKKDIDVRGMFWQQ